MLLAVIALLMVADFVFRGILPALGPGKNDFSEVYVGAWMWRHGLNFYDPALATATGDQLGNTRVSIVLIYPPTALVLFSPFTFLPWTIANLTWMLVGLAGVAATVALLIILAGWNSGEDRAWEDRAWLLGTLVLAFDPLHQAFHLGNAALIVVPLCLFGTYLGEKGKDLACGLSLGVAAALKPQLGVWFLAFYLLQLRRKILLGALLAAAALALAFLRFPVPAGVLFSSYRSNLAYWFDPGRPYSFTEGSLPFHVNITQTIFYRLLHSPGAASFAAYALFVCGLAAWSYAVWRSWFRVSAPLAISSLAGLSFVALYHSVSDVTILTLALCWAMGGQTETRHWTQNATLVLFLLLMLPGHSALMRFTPHLGSGLVGSWWWNLFVARYFVWLLLTLNFVLLWALIDGGERARSVDSRAS